MAEETQIEKDDWQTILGELDEISRELNQLSEMTLGNKDAFEDDEFPTLIHFISEIKKEKKSQSWEKIEGFSKLIKENLKFLDETQQIKLQNKMIDRSFIGVLPKNTTTIGNNVMEILNHIPIILEIINESIRAMFIDIKLKLGLPIVKFEKEVLDIKHQIELLAEEVKSHTKIKKGFASKDEQMIYTQAFRETYLEIIEKSQNYIIRDFKTHSRAYEDVYDRFTNKMKNYRESPAYDDFIKGNIAEVEKAIDNWPTEGFKAFSKALKFIRKIDDRLSDTRQTFIQQIKTELDKDINELVATVESLWTLENKIDGSAFSKMKETSDKVISAARFFIRTVDVVATDPHDKLVNDPKILQNATEMATIAFEATFGVSEEDLAKYIKQVLVTKSTKKLLSEIEEVKQNTTEPNNLDDILTSIPFIVDFAQKQEMLLKELAADLLDTQEKYIKKIKTINKQLGKSEAIDVFSEDQIIKLDTIILSDMKPLQNIGKLLKEALSQAAKAIGEFESQFSDNLGFNINPQLDGKLTKYRRPSYSPTVKQANNAMSELEKFAKDLAMDTGVAIEQYSKDLKNFSVKSKALKEFQKLLKSVAKDAIGGKIDLSQITTRLEQVITEYSKLLLAIITENATDLNVILMKPDSIDFSDLDLESFNSKHTDFISNISFESVIKQQEEKKKELSCAKCGAKIVWKQEDYNDMLAVNVLKVRCENNHEETIIGFDSDDEEEEAEPIEVKCAKCSSEALTPSAIDLFSKGEMIVTATCPKKHKTEFIIKS
ncbi:MAG: hypothetical protein ACTSXA_15080 [Candidatus Heimdallarchaeota archaeon]